MTTDIAGEWLHFDNSQPKRKRAELVCSSCHGKKIKCDLQKRSSQGQSKCTNCHTAARDCHVRPSKRRRTATVGVEQRPPASLSPENDTRAEADVPRNESPVLVHQESPSLQRTDHASTSDMPVGAATSRSNPSDVDTGFLQIYGPENQYDAEQQELKASLEHGYRHSNTQQQELLQIFAETYVDYAYPWCPVLDLDRIQDDTIRSPLLANSLALAASHIRPPLIPHEGPAAYYDKARAIFYNDEEPDGLTTLQAISLFYWWAPRPPSIAHRHSSWWWTSVLIRHAQQMNFHREPRPQDPSLGALNLSLRRRIWWTAFARERLTALCQSKPCIIDPLDCNIQDPTLADFPGSPDFQRKGEIFIYWVRLCGIIGNVAKCLSRSTIASSPPSPEQLRQDLVGWVTSLPPHLQLPIGSARTASFDRDVHQLHLPYLTTIIVLHLKRSAHALPQALPPAILAASCIARILRDILSRGDARFLMAITCWYSGMAFIALLQASRIENLSQDATEGLNILTNAVEQLQRMWGTANIIRQGFDRLRSQSGPMASEGTGPGNLGVEARARQSIEGLPSVDRPHNDDANAQDYDWTNLFPFVTRQTNRIAEALLPSNEPGAPQTRFPSPENMLFHETLMTEYQDLFEPFAPYESLDFSNAGFFA
ncbi:hypothetical protein JX265_002037 [Neoarthrinium moseri]|uniref:Zn(2)-C6 fungal-type domain-containing protein n=1 Tax=Neoarthrinium moseri TaxID=1658444 RepID=A0A9P9WW89_9PEZI|nr:hypothetical protein JX265_002037 [Neoarthrinium moseri]